MPGRLAAFYWNAVRRVPTSFRNTRIQEIEMTADQFLATCWTTAGDIAPDEEDQRSPLNLRERVEAARDAGFTAFGLLYWDLVEAEREYGMAGIRSLFEDNGISHIEVELLTDWWADGPRRAASDA